MDILDCGEGINREFDEREQDAAMIKTASANYMQGVRAGIKACEANVREALEADPHSELWGEHGLLAATMRCVRALRECPCCGRGDKDCDCDPKSEGKAW